jgi:hypothetical protein
VLDDGDNHSIDPGEVADLVLPISNHGDLAEPDVRIVLESDDPLISITGNGEKTIENFKALSRHEIRYRLSCSRLAPFGHTFSFTATALAGDSVLTERLFTLDAGKRLIAVASLTATGNSLTAMNASLDSLGIVHDSFTDMVFEPEKYESVFIILGSSSGGTHTLTLEEAGRLAGYLNRGGRLYMEGYYTWHYTNQTLLHPMFMIATEQSPVGFFSHPQGIPSTFTETFDFNYVNPLNYCIFRLSPMASAFPTLQQQDDSTLALEIAYEGQGYKTIGTMLEFGSMNGTTATSSRTQLMTKYLEFFGLNITGPHALFHSDTSAICAGATLQFSDDSYDSIRSWHWEFPGGEPAVSDQPSPQVTYALPGTYDVTLTVSNGQRSDVLTRKKYVHAAACSSVPSPEPARRYRLFPNPSEGTFCIEGLSGGRSDGFVSVIDVIGRVIWKEPLSIENGCITLPEKYLRRPGICFVRIHSGTTDEIHKLVIVR